MNSCIEYLTKIRDLMSEGRQRAFAQAKVDAAREVVITPISEIFTKDEIAMIAMVGIRKKECWKNATLVTTIFPDVDYVEGLINTFGLPIEHAFNRRGDKYFDVTFDLLFPGDKEREYCAILELTATEVMERVIKQNYYSDMFAQIYFENVKLPK